MVKISRKKFSKKRKKVLTFIYKGVILKKFLRENGTKYIEK